jgi:hypothetical protein
MGSSSKSTVTNNISNLTINKNELEAFNSQVNEFVTNVVTKNTAACSSGATMINENSMGDINVVGKKQKVNATLNASQKSQVSLDCIQKAIQQTNVGNSVAQGIMQNLQNSVSNEQLTAMVAQADSKTSSGFGGFNPFSSANSEINMNLSNTQINETSRKLSNMISNKVASNTNNSSFQECGSKSFLQQGNKVGNLNVLGDENEVNLTLNSDQYSEVISKCEQLTQQTAESVSDVATTLGVVVKDDTENKTKSDTASTAKSINEAKGIGDLISGIFGMMGLGFLSGPIGSAICVCCCVICCVLSFFLLMKGGEGGDNSDSPNDESETKTEKEEPKEEPSGEEPAES